MRARARLAGIAAIGAAIGLALSAVIADPATAAKPQPSATASTATYSCSHFSGLTVTGDSVVRNSVGLKAGETIVDEEHRVAGVEITVDDDAS